MVRVRAREWRRLGAGAQRVAWRERTVRVSILSPAAIGA